MTPIVDARSGKVVKIGEPVVYPGDPDAGYTIESVSIGVFSGKAAVRKTYGRIVVGMPIRWFPKLTYGPHFPVDGLRAAILPT